jgi:hypothetical protein
MTGSTVLSINFCFLVISPFIIKLQCTHGAVLHAAAAAQAFVFINNRILAAGRTKIEKLRGKVLFLLYFLKKGFRCKGVATCLAFLKLES